MHRQSSPLPYLLLTSLVGFLLLVAGLWPVATRTNAQAESDALLRFLNASPNGPVDVYIEDARTAENLAFMAATDYGTIPAGLYTIKVVVAGGNPADQPLLEGSAQLMPGTAHSLVLFDRAQSLKAQLLVDDLTPPESGASLRFFHAAPEASVVDVVTSGGQTLFQAIPFGQEGASIRLAAGEYALEVRPVGNATPVLTQTLQLGDGSIQTALAVGFANQQPPLQLWVVEYPPPGNDLSGFPPLIPQITSGGQATPSAAATSSPAAPTATAGGAPAEAYPQPTTTVTTTATATETQAATVTPTTEAATATPTTEAATATPTSTPAATEAPGEATATPTTTPEAGMPTTGGDDGGNLGSLFLMVLGLALLDVGVFLFWRREWLRVRRPF
ncbi:MAG: DUF4397 domain-containing protein [Ardenticatenaceae bacterium]|nr:DUF4397 domain-containing protein [Ardenticatenaceae bacterium]